jgi:hypothetical protein
MEQCVCSCRFDAEMQQLQEALRQEKTGKEKALRERDMATAEKTSAEQNLAVCCFTYTSFFLTPNPPQFLSRLFGTWQRDIKQRIVFHDIFYYFAQCPKIRR